MRPFAGLIPLLAILLFLGALFWARGRDPFTRKWFTFNTTDYGSIKCVAVLPKPIRPRPAIVFAHGSGGNLMTDGQDLRQMAELGLAVVSLEYNQTNEAAFAPQLEALLRYLFRQKWANTNAMAWVGFSLGANRMLKFALQHPERQPQLLVQLGGQGFAPDPSPPHSSPGPSAVATGQLAAGLHCPVLLVHGELDGVFPLPDAKRRACLLQSNGLPARLQIIAGASHAMAPERGVIFRCIGEYCLTHLAGEEAWQNYYSIAQWQAQARPLWLYWLPAAIWVVGRLVWSRCRRVAARVPLSRVEIVLRRVALLLATWALAVTAVHVVTPHLLITDRILTVARKCLVQSRESGDFEYLASQSIWQGQKLKTLLTHVELAVYNRELINWQVDDKTYRDFVLSPVITGRPDEQLNWRRPLWEEFYPRIRHESAPDDAARIVVRHLRERVTIANVPNPPRDVPAIWLRQITDETGFEIIYVAALRSVGVPARLNSQHQAEFWDGSQWHVAPVPVVTTWSLPQF